MVKSSLLKRGHIMIISRGRDLAEGGLGCPCEGVLQLLLYLLTRAQVPVTWYTTA